MDSNPHTRRPLQPEDSDYSLTNRLVMTQTRLRPRYLLSGSRVSIPDKALQVVCKQLERNIQPGDAGTP